MRARAGAFGTRDRPGAARGQDGRFSSSIRGSRARESKRRYPPIPSRSGGSSWPASALLTTTCWAIRTARRRGVAMDARTRASRPVRPRARRRRTRARADGEVCHRAPAIRPSDRHLSSGVPARCRRLRRRRDHAPHACGAPPGCSPKIVPQAREVAVAKLLGRRSRASRGQRRPAHSRRHRLRSRLPAATATSSGSGRSSSRSARRAVSWRDWVR